MVPINDCHLPSESRPRYLVALLLDRPCRPLWVYRPVKRSSPDTCGRKPLKHPGVVGAAIGFKSPSSHFQHLIVPLLADHEPASRSSARNEEVVLSTEIAHRRLRDCAGPAQFVTVGDGP